MESSGNGRFGARILRGVVIAVGSLAILSTSPSNERAGYYAAPKATAAAAFEVTSRDISASNQKVRMAHAALAEMWTRDFNEIGEHFAEVEDLAHLLAVHALVVLLEQLEVRSQLGQVLLDEEQGGRLWAVGA